MGDRGLLSDVETDVLSDVYMALLPFSLIGSFSVLVVSIIKWSHLRVQVHLLVQLALADLLAALILMSTSIMNKFSSITPTGCQYILPLSLTFYFISFLLVAAYAWNSKYAMQGWRERAAEDEHGQRQCRRNWVAKLIYPLVWAIPLSLYFIYVVQVGISSKPPISSISQNWTIQNNSVHCNRCILFLHVFVNSCSVPGREIKSKTSSNNSQDHFIRIFLSVVVISVMISCSFIYYKVGKWYESRTHYGLFPVEGDGLSRKRFKSVFTTSRNMVIVIFFCWLPALLLILLSDPKSANIRQNNLFGLYVIQAATVSLQGFLNSMVYAWRRTNFTEAVLGENTPLVGYNQMAFFDESLPT